MELLRVLSFLAVFFVVVNNFNRRRQIDRLIKMVVFLGFFISVFAILQRYTWNGKIYWIRPITQKMLPFGPFINENHFAAYIGMIIPFCISLIFLERSGEKKSFFAFAAVIMMTALALSSSRAGIASLVFSLGLTGILVRQRNFFKNRFKTFVFLIVAAVAFILIFGSPIVAGRFGEFLQPAKAEMRLGIWKDTFDLIKDFPVFGTGLATFVDVLPMYKTYSSEINFAHAFNEYLEIFAEMGTLGFVVFIIAVLIFFKKVFYDFLLNKSSLLRRHDPFVVVYGTACMASLLMAGFHNMLDFNLHVPAVAIYTSFILGLGLNVVRSKLSEDKQDVPVETRSIKIQNRPLLVLGYAGIIIIFTFSSISIAGAYVKDRGFRAAIGTGKDAEAMHKEAILNNPSSASRWLELGLISKDETLLRTAISLDPSNPKFRRKLARYYTFYSEPADTQKALQEYRKAIELSQNVVLQGEVLNEVSKNISDDIETLRAAIPQTSEANIEFVYFLIENKGDEIALSELDRVFALAKDQGDTKTEAAAFNIKGVIYQGREDFYTALEMFEKAIALDDEQPFYFCSLGWAHLRLDNFHQSERAFKKALEIRPGYALAYFRLGRLYERKELLKQAQHQYEKILMLPLDSVRQDMRTKARVSLKRIKKELYTIR